MHWLNAGYCVWFNRRYRRSGHLLQGRFGAFLVEDDAGWQELARYVHLNPVRVKGLGLDKTARVAAKTGLPLGQEPELVAVGTTEMVKPLRRILFFRFQGGLE